MKLAVMIIIFHKFDIAVFLFELNSEKWIQNSVIKIKNNFSRYFRKKTPSKMFDWFLDMLLTQPIHDVPRMSPKGPKVQDLQGTFRGLSGDQCKN